MFGVLLESRARRQRRTGGAALSVATHMAIVGAAAAFTVPRPPATKPPIEVYSVSMAPEPPKARLAPPRDATSAHPFGPVVPTIDIRLPVPVMSTEIPPIDMTHGPPLDSLLLNTTHGSGGNPRGRPGAFDLIGDPNSGSEWRGSEAMMRVITQAKPRYPESLRQAAVDGRVLVQFNVDTLGVIDPASVRILSSTHELFSRAVRDALGGFRFRPAEVNGRRVIALAEMPFEFAIRR